ncbi:hypothetical protein ACTXT7_003532 [Hymenolepis weldensis]
MDRVAQITRMTEMDARKIGRTSHSTSTRASGVSIDRSDLILLFAGASKWVLEPNISSELQQNVVRYQCMQEPTSWKDIDT